MGLELAKVLPNGIPVTYHRIKSLVVIINCANKIEYASYLSKSERDRELNAEDVYVFINSVSLDYDPEMDVVKAYEYLKTLPDFEGAKDVIEPENYHEDPENDDGQDAQDEPEDDPENPEGGDDPETPKTSDEQEEPTEG